MHECMIGWNYSRIYKHQDSRHSGSRRIEFSQLSWEVPTENPYMGAIWGGLPRERGDIRPYSPPAASRECIAPPPSRGGFGSVVRPCLVAHRGASPQRTRSRERWPCHRNSPGPMAPPQGGRIQSREGSCRGPDGPPIGFVPVSFTSKCTNILGLIGW